VDQGPDGAYELIDYKTGPAVPSEEEVGRDAQLRFYALGAKRGLGLKPALLTVDCVAAGRRVSAVYLADGEEALSADIRTAADAIEAGDFAPETSYCPRCDFRADCPHSTARP
ncbi:MAG: PD-(D/E)XK nuclease family protein, partial [Elusimicrobia bacterium]|nr:PD-(D/E)XK nuclease family protein [Elusimicrobiota bacterium]